MSKSLTYVEIDIPSFEPTVVLLHFSFISSPAQAFDQNTGGSAHTWTAFGNAAIVADGTSPLGGSNVLTLDGTGDYITTPDSDDFTLGDEDFTVDCWFKCAATGGSFRDLAGQRDAGATFAGSSWAIGRDSANFMKFQVYVGSTELSIFGTTLFTNALNTGWHHIAAVRYGNVLKLFIDGVQEGGNLAISGSVNDTANVMGVGSAGALTSNTWFGSVDEFRLTKGIARWTSNFTVPSAPNNAMTTYRFAIDTSYLPNDIACIPSIKEVAITPAIISLGENVGQRASVAVTFRDHKHIFANEAFDDGTFWGKFRKRYGLKLKGFLLRLIRGNLGQNLVNMETRHFVIDSVDGPAANGEYKIVAKDVLKLADGDTAQAPILSNGFLLAAINNAVTSFTLSPSGIGNSEYPASGHVNIGGKEICSFTRSGDTMTITRAQFNTTAVAHDISERAQLCLRYTTQDVAVIISDLLLNYTDVISSWVPLATWQTETAAYLATSYTALIAEPTSVSKLISELVEQAGLAIWWDDINQHINLQVLRPIASNAFVYNADNYIASSLEVKEQPEKRLSQIYTYFAKLSPLVNEDQINNYRSTAYTTDAVSESRYGSASIKKIYSRWIPDGGRAIATTLNGVLLARFKDPPRRISFDVLRGSGSNPVFGVGYQIQGWPFQNLDGTADTIAAQITRLNPKADVFEVEAEEISSTAFQAAGASPDVHTVIIDTNHTNVNMRSMHDSIYGAPVSGQTINFTVSAGVSVGTTSYSPAMTTGSWPGGVTVNLTVNGRIQGLGGKGGTGRSRYLSAGTGTPGSPGGVALEATSAINLTDTAGQIWGGGGGGGGGDTPAGIFTGVSCGGGGAGNTPGDHGDGDSTCTHSASGTTEAGGAAAGSPSGHNGGNGGNPGAVGGTSVDGLAGGTAGLAINGIAFVTTVGAPGDRRGGTA